MTDARWRCFVAVPLGDDLRAALAAAADGWCARDELAGLRWANPVGWHLTLAFLGAVEPGDLPAIRTAMTKTAAEHLTWRTRTGGVGGFPSAVRARVAWYGVSDPEGRLATLAGDLRATLGLEGGGRFRAHVTLARARREPVDLRGWIADASAPEEELVVDRVVLMRSHLGAGPARYETLATASIGASNGV
jgi:2'-5' RNA ligase